MKRWLLALLVTGIFGCTKERPPSLLGRWTIIETSAGTGWGFATTTYTPSSELVLQFQEDGDLSVSGPNPGRASSELWEYNRYEVLADNRIRFFNSQTGAETRAGFALNHGLTIWYEWARCGHEEKFIRLGADTYSGQ